MQRVLNTFDAYQKARVKFVQSVAQLSLREQNASLMENAGVMKMLQPLLVDQVPAIRQSASVALARLASHSQGIAEHAVQEGLISALADSMKNGSSYDRKAGAFAMRSVSKHSSELAHSVLKVGTDSLKLCLNDVNMQVKEEGVWACDYVAKHEDASLATSLSDAGIVPLLVMCLEEPEPSLKRIATISLATIAKHSVSLAQSVVDAKALESFSVLLGSNDSKLKRQVCACVAQIAKHSDELCNRVANGHQDSVFRKILSCVRSTDDAVRRNALICVREVSRRSSKHADMIVQDGGIKMLLDAVRRDSSSSEGDPMIRLAGCTSLGFLASFSSEAALKISNLGGVELLRDVLNANKDDNELRSSAVWALGQICRHVEVPPQKDTIFDAIRTWTSASKSDSESGIDLKSKSSSAVEMMMSNCNDLNLLERVALNRDEVAARIRKFAIQQIAVVLTKHPGARRSFVERGMLREIQRLDENKEEENKEEEQEVDGDEQEMQVLIEKVLRCFPADVAQHNSDQYGEALVSRHYGNI